MDSSTDKPQTNFQWKPWIRGGIAVAVSLAVCYTLWNAVGQLRDHAFDLRKVDYGWWAAAVASYAVSMTLSGVVWHQILIAMGQRPKLLRSLAAFFASQLGKYVPGKAMVVVLRTDLIRGDDVATGPAVASTFVETLTWLFVGSAIASLLLLISFDQPVLQAVAAIMMLVSGVLTAPTVIRMIATRMGHVKGKKTGKALLGLNLKTMFPAWMLLAIGWCFNGLSLWLVMQGMPGVELLWSDYPLTLTCVTLATAAGFASLLPGGLGVRELVMIPLLGVRFDPALAVVAAVAIRAVWLIAELFLAGLMYAGPLRGRRG